VSPFSGDRTWRSPALGAAPRRAFRLSEKPACERDQEGVSPFSGDRTWRSPALSAAPRRAFRLSEKTAREREKQPPLFKTAKIFYNVLMSEPLKNKFEYSALLTPNRSLSPQGFLIFMVLISIVCFTTGFVFMLMGAWPVMGFMGLDVLLVYWAFRRNYYDAKIFETIDLTSNELVLERVYPSGRRQSWVFNPFWIKVGLEEHSSGATKMHIKSHGKTLTFGQFLSDDERREFTAVLRQEIRSANNTLQPS